MGCNCATQEQIKKLHQLYGEKTDLNKTLTQRTNEFLRNILIYLILIIISPLTIGFVLYKVFLTKDKRISVRKIMRFKSGGIDEALVKNIIDNTNIVESE